MLFKGKTLNGEWIEGCLTWTLEKDRYFIREQKCGIDVEVIPETVGQFTGVVDRNGTKVFEGDKVKVYENCNGEIKPWEAFVKYSGSSFSIYNPDCCDVCKNGGGCICNLDECMGEFEIIGNIHDK